MTNEQLDQLRKAGYTQDEINTLVHNIQYRKQYNQRSYVKQYHKEYNRKKNERERLMKAIIRGK